MTIEPLKKQLFCIWKEIKSSIGCRSNPDISAEIPNKKSIALKKDEPDTAAIDRESILSNGWRQGAMISREDDHFKSLRLPDDDCELYVLASHSCDVAAYAYTKEPFAEFVGANFSPKEDKALAHRRNPRKLQISVCDSASTFITLDINSRCFVNRKLLARGNASDFTITKEALNELQMWLASRYRRSAFPDAFNTRILGIKKVLEEDIKKNGDRNIYGLYLNLNTLEELGDDNYVIGIIGVIKENLGETGDSELREAEDYLEFVKQQFLACDGIEVSANEVVADSAITLKTIRELKLFDFDYLSHRAETEVPEPVL